MSVQMRAWAYWMYRLILAVLALGEGEIDSRCVSRELNQ
jgi:hypothetical protein